MQGILNLSAALFWMSIMWTILRPYPRILKNSERPLPSKNSMGNTLLTVQLSFMFPAIESVLSELNFKQIRKTNEKYWRLLEIERRYCRKHAAQIQELAYKVYKIACNSNHVLYHTCCDFTLLEKICRNYTGSMHEKRNTEA